jgi:two-component system, LytTR family, sensor histidine kinase LytS
MSFFIHKNTDLIKVLVKNRWLWHVGFWLLYLAFQSRSYYGITYFTIYLYKRLFIHQNYILYFLIGLILWSGYLCILSSFQKYYLASIPDMAQSQWSDIVLNQLSTYLAFFFFITTAKFFKDTMIRQYYEKEKENQRISTELKHLKAQISPHFLFNTLNNFYGLAVVQSVKLPDLMIRLSDLLRYSLYETNNRTVPLLNEITYLKNYIELEKIRLEDTLDFEFLSDVDASTNFEIAPLIFVVFIENAFKHAKNVKDDVIRIKVKIAITESGELIFEVKNNYLLEVFPQNTNQSGLGLENVKKRLEVMYPEGLHKLKVEQKDCFFHILLHINLNKQA